MEGLSNKWENVCLFICLFVCIVLCVSVRGTGKKRINLKVFEKETELHE